jgi:hypothetical protein
LAKYISKNESTGAMGKVYHTNTHCPALIGARVVEVTESMLRFYEITKECKLCASIPEKRVKDIKDSDLKGRAILLNNAAKIAEKHFGREVLRGYCKEYSLPFTMRSTKPKMARSVCRYWIKNGMLQRVYDFTIESKIHWEKRIEVGDKHRPYLYKEMSERCANLLSLLAKEGINGKAAT